MFYRSRKDFKKHGSSVLNLAFWSLQVYRFGVWSMRLPPGILRDMTSMMYGTMSFVEEVATGNQFNREATLGEDVHIVHSGNIRIHPETVIGNRVGIMHNVTLGTNMEREGAPIVGDDVFIGTGATILGAVKIGDGARIAANSLVISDVPPGATAIGVPARILRYTGRTEEENNNKRTTMKE